MIATRHSLDDARVVHKEAISLANAGYDVYLILSCNNRYEYVRNDGSVIATGKPPDGEVDYMGFKVFGRPKRKGLSGKWKTHLELSRLAAGLKADVYHAHEPDLSLAIAVRAKHLLAKQGFPAHIVHDMHEYPPGGPTDKSPQLLKFPILLAHILWNKLSMKWVDQVFTANNIVRGYALSLSYRMSVDVLYNAPILKLFPQPATKFWSEKGENLLLCHEGSLPFNRGLKEMVEAVYYFRDKVCLRIVGDVFGEERKWLKREIENKGLHDTIRITGWLPYEKVSEAISDCHVGLILFRDSINNRLAGPPNKLFNYMNAGLPVLSVDFPEMRQIIVEEECGILICDQSVKSIITAIETLLANPENLSKMSKNGQRAVRERYSWEVMERKLLLSYGRLCGKVK
jgi:glycosyltransferase involved in cell wall biosynthesis